MQDNQIIALIYNEILKICPVTYTPTIWIIEWLTYCDSILIHFLHTLQLILNFPNSAFAEASYRVNLKMTALKKEWILHSAQYVWRHRDEMANKLFTWNPTWCSNQNKPWKNKSTSLIMLNTLKTRFYTYMPLFCVKSNFILNNDLNI